MVGLSPWNCFAKSSTKTIMQGEFLFRKEWLKSVSLFRFFVLRISEYAVQGILIAVGLDSQYQV